MRQIGFTLSLLTALMLSACNLNTLTKIDLQTEYIDIPYPASDSASIEVVIDAAADIRVRGGGDKLVEGTIEYNVREWGPKVEVDDDSVRIAQGEGVNGTPPREAKNDWDLRLGDRLPFELDIKADVGTGRWDLGGLPIAGMKLNMGVGDNEITFADPDPGRMRRLDIDGGVGDLRVRDLLNANPARLAVEGGVGDITLEFTGEALSQSIEVDVDGGVGTITIIVDKDVPARVEVTEGMGAVGRHGDFERRGGGFETPTYAEADDAARLEIVVLVGVGAITLDTR